MTLHGWRTFDAAVFCAAVAAGQRYLLDPAAAPSKMLPPAPVTADSATTHHPASSDCSEPAQAQYAGDSQSQTGDHLPLAQWFVSSSGTMQAGNSDGPLDKAQQGPQNTCAGSKEPRRTRRKVGIASTLSTP